jgi:ketosteroid isomerase-like protein
VAKHKNTVLVQAIYGAFLRGDMPAILDKLADNIEWVVGTPSDVVPTFGTFKGKAAVGQFFQKLGEHVDMKKFEPNEYIAQYDKVVAFVHSESVVKKTGKPVSQDIVMVWTVQDGKVTKFRGYEDTQAAVAGFSGG